MRIHIYEQETDEDKTWLASGGASRVVCGKNIKNANLTTDDHAATCATCMKIWTKARVAAKAA